MMRFLVTISLLFVTVSAHAQINFTGKVIDKATGEVLPGVIVECKHHRDSYSLTNEQGAFSVHLKTQDSVAFKLMGYQTLRLLITSSNSNAVVSMFPLITEIQEIEITAERIIAEEFTSKKIKKLDIYTNPSAKADPILAVASSASSTTTDESANLSLRGGSPDETGIFFNNVPIHDAVRYSQLNGIGTFSIFNTALVNSVLVYPGNPPLEFGNSTSGLIALQSDETIPSKNTATAALSLASLGFLTSRPIGSKSSITIFSNYQPSLFIRKLNTEALKQLKNFSSLDLGIHFYSKPTKTTAVKIFNYSVSESYEFQYEQPSYSGIFFQRKKRNFTIANVRKRRGKLEFSWNQGFSFSHGKYDYGITHMDVKLNDLFSSLNVQQVSDRFEWKSGISYEHRGSEFSGTFPLYDFAAGEHHPVFSVASSDDTRSPESYVYFKRYLGKWIVGGGLRKNIALKHHKNFLSYQANVHYGATDHLTLNLSYGRYNKVQLPNGEEAKTVLTTSDQLSLDIKQTNSKGESSFSIYARKSQALRKESEVFGIEFFNRYRLTRNLRSQFSITSLEASDEVDGEKSPSPYNIHYFLRGNLEYKFKGTWTITSVFLFRQGSYFQTVQSASYNEDLQVYVPLYSDDSQRLPAYHTIDLSASKLFMLTKKISAVAFASAGNIINFENVRDYTYSRDYSHRKPHLFSKRTVYFGIVLNW